MGIEVLASRRGGKTHPSSQACAKRRCAKRVAVAFDEDKQEFIFRCWQRRPVRYANCGNRRWCFGAQRDRSVNCVYEPKQPAAAHLAARSKEFAMRTALGAGFDRLMGQQLRMPEKQSGERADRNP
jgi:hypothetical protein